MAEQTPFQLISPCHAMPAFTRIPANDHDAERSLGDSADETP